MGELAGGMANQRIQADLTIPKLQELQGAIDALHGKNIAITVSVGSAGTGTDTSPGRAAGGPVMGGAPYLVGERGPELFVPNANGNIVNNRDTRAMMGGVTVNNYGTLQVKLLNPHGFESEPLILERQNYLPVYGGKRHKGKALHLVVNLNAGGVADASGSIVANRMGTIGQCFSPYAETLGTLLAQDTAAAGAN